jgi:activator of HSP90 ATPase
VFIAELIKEVSVGDACVVSMLTRFVSTFDSSCFVQKWRLNSWAKNRYCEVPLTKIAMETSVKKVSTLTRRKLIET